MDPVTTPAPTPTAAPGFSLGGLFANPLIRHIAGIAMTLLIGLIGMKLGIMPQPVPIPLPITLSVQAAPGLVVTQAK